MTLNITIATADAVFQSADHRLIDPDNESIITSQSSKSIKIIYSNWSGLLTYTGNGRWQSRDTHEFINDWISTISNCTIDEFAEQIRVCATHWFGSIPEKQRFLPHVFTLAAISNDAISVRTVGVYTTATQPVFTINTHNFSGKPKIIITGCSEAVSEGNKKLLNRLARDRKIDPHRVRLLLSQVNRDAARMNGFRNRISESCTTSSLDRRGRMYSESNGPRNNMIAVTPVGLIDLRQILASLSHDPDKLTIAASTVGRSDAKPPLTCVPRIVAMSKEYEISEICVNDLRMPIPVMISASGLILGNALDHNNNSSIWLAQPGESPHVETFVGRACSMNEAGVYTGQNLRKDRSHHMFLATKAKMIGVYTAKGLRESCGLSINANGLVGGWVCFDVPALDQQDQRGAIWSEDRCIAINEGLEGDRSEIVTVNDNNIALIRSHRRFETWGYVMLAAEARTIRLREPSIYVVFLNNRNWVLGYSEIKSKAFVQADAGGWQTLGLRPGYRPAHMNDLGDIVGSRDLDGIQVPWLLRPNGTLIDLPYFEYHHHFPRWINSELDIVGESSSDHGSHAVLWRAAKL